MKIKLDVEEDEYEEIKDELEKHGIETDDNADFVLSRINKFSESLTVRNKRTNEHIILPCEKIIYIESYGHSIDIHTENDVYQMNERLYKILSQLDSNSFLRISNSVIVSKKHIKKISPTLSMKFILTLSDSTRVDVTRSYYYAFKEAFGI
ncbi:MAG: LytTR family transcriptional regulator [Ruminococcus sp.]|nr:LytTR family transcriptional regulator [Ruminococcus sp.]